MNPGKFESKWYYYTILSHWKHKQIELLRTKSKGVLNQNIVIYQETAFVNITEIVAILFQAEWVTSEANHNGP